jgi:hypothetical protein
MPEAPSTVDIFVSHSSRDEELAKRLVTLIRSALNMPATGIRCTSVDGYRLPVGISVDEKLRQEIHDSNAFIVLLTPNSTASLYVLFELGARWGIRKPLIPLLSGGSATSLLNGPLSAINGLSCDNEAQLFQFVADLAAMLRRTPEGPSVYHKCIVELSDASRRSWDITVPGSTTAPETGDRDLIQSLRQEIEVLRYDLFDQLSKMRDVMRAATLDTSSDEATVAIRRLEGVWRAPKDGSVFCVKVVGNELRVPYSYGAGNMLTGYLFNCVVRGDTITCKFKWVATRIHGFAVLRAVNEDTLSGGWCYAEDLRPEEDDLLPIQDLPLDRLIGLTVQRDHKSLYPRWAEDYFWSLQR